MASRASRKCALAVGLVLLVAARGTAQSLSGMLAIPVYSDSYRSLLTAEGLAVGKELEAGRMDLFLGPDEDHRISMSGLRLREEGFWAGVGVVEIPSINPVPSLGLDPVDGFSMPVAGIGASADIGDCVASLSLGFASVPEVPEDFSFFSASLVADRATLISGSLGWEGYSIFAGSACLRSRIVSGGFGRIGDLDASLGFVGLRGESWGLLCGEASARERLQIGGEDPLLELLGIDLPWASSAGDIDADFAAAWYLLRLDRGSWGAGIDALAIAVFTKDASIETTYHESGGAERRWLWSMTSKFSGFAIIRPSVFWRLSRGPTIGVAHALPLLWGWRTSAGDDDRSASTASNASSLPSSGAGSSGSRLLSAVLSGLQVFLRYPY